MSEKKEIIEVVDGNKLIAGFDGMLIGKLSGWMSGNVGEKAYRKVDGEVTDVYSFEKLKYHTSWDWLMPVVEKINSLSYNDSNNKFQPTVERFLENDIDSIWRQIIIFITWYNKTQQNEPR